MGTIKDAVVGFFCVGMMFGLVTCGSGSGSSSSPGTTPGVASQLNPSVSQPTKFPISSVEYLDSGADGKQDVAYHRTHDNAGNIVSEKQDYSVDGDTNVSIEMTYDGSGNLIKYAVDSDDDGSADDTYECTYDGHNILTSIVHTSESDNSTVTATNTYDEEGRIIKKVVDYGGYGTEYAMQYGYRDGYGYYRVESEWKISADYTNWFVGYWLSEDLSERKTYTACWYDLSGYLQVTCTKSEKTDYGDMARATSLETSPATGIFVENKPPALEDLLALTESLIDEMASSDQVTVAEYASRYDSFGNLVVFATPDSGGTFQSIKARVNTYADGTTTSYTDADGDGFPEGADCDDNNSSALLPSEEVCDGIDNDCDGQVDEDGGDTYFADVDGDGYGNESSSTTACSQPTGFVTNDDDCNDADPAQFNSTTRYYPDADGDGHGAEHSDHVDGCVAPAGYAEGDDDCDDNDPSVYEGAEEIIDGKNNDCDHMVDETTYYHDYDNDGYGDDKHSVESETEVSYGSYVTQAGDCDDDNGAMNPGMRDCADPSKPIQGQAGVDDNCDGIVDDDVGCAHPDLLEAQPDGSKI